VSPKLPQQSCERLDLNCTPDLVEEGSDRLSSSELIRSILSIGGDGGGGVSASSPVGVGVRMGAGPVHLLPKTFNLKT
jgi:hypothetical protein